MITGHLVNIITWTTDVLMKYDENDILLNQYINKCSEESREPYNQFNRFSSRNSNSKDGIVI